MTQDSIPDNNGPYAQALACSGQTLAFLRAHEISPQPNAYAVGYAYSSGSHPELSNYLDRQLKSGHKLDDFLFNELYERFLHPEASAGYQGMGVDLHALLETLQQAISSAGEENTQFRKLLEQSIGNLDQTQDSGSLGKLIHSLLDSAKSMHDKTAGLENRLDEANHEVDRLKKEIEHRRREALTDPLTGLYNRRGMELLVGDLFEQDLEMSMLALDIDFFKRFNDTYGHPAGDTVLRHVADALRKAIRGEDVAVRYGGEEFVILLPHTAMAGAMTVAETLRKRIAEMRLIRRHDKLRLPTVTVSIGVSARKPDDDLDSLYQRADKALYISKTLGRNRVSSEV